MAYLTNIANPEIEKKSLVVVKPRVRHTGWILVSAGIYSSTFTRGYVTRVWSSYLNTDGFVNSGNVTPAVGQFYYDHATQTVYAGSLTNPDAYTYAGLTLEYELNLSSDYYMGPRDPMDNTSSVVEWIPCLSDIPKAANGSRDYLYGFFPIQESAVKILNQDGRFTPLLHDSTFNLALCKAYILASNDEINSSNVRQVFIGYTSGIEFDQENITLSCTDYTKIFQRDYRLDDRFNTTDFPNIEPSAIENGTGWWIRKILGMVDGLKPVNISYNATPGTSNNRTWITHIEDGTGGSITQTVNHLGANTTTRTFFLDIPRVNIGDWVQIINNSVSYYVEVEDVSRGAGGTGYIDHEPIVRTVIAGDTVTRLAVARLIVEDEDGQSWWLRPNLDYTLTTQVLASGNVAHGFVMANNWEATNGGGFTHTPFDPSKHKVICRVYGMKSLDTYSDLVTDVGSVVDNGGIAAQAVSILFKLIKHAGFSINDIDDSTFGTVGGGSHALGLSIPESIDSDKPQTYLELISSILESMLWKLSFVEYSNGLKLGLVATEPFAFPAPTTVTESDFRNLNFSHDYADIYSDVILSFALKQNRALGLSGLPKPFFTEWDHIDGIATSENESAKDLHFTNRTYKKTILQYDGLEAQKIADRMAFALSDRRGLYGIVLGSEHLPNSNLGAYVEVSAENLPGYDFVYGIENARQMVIIEVQKSSEGVTITLEDQKAIDDNSGAWPY